MAALAYFPAECAATAPDNALVVDGLVMILRVSLTCGPRLPDLFRGAFALRLAWARSVSCFLGRVFCY